MNETSKTRPLWTEDERRILSGSGIDIGCGPDPVLPSVRPFDLQHGDAQHITRYVQDTFDFVYSSHCLEHMPDPPLALREWWSLIKPGGYLFIIVPDEDLYEQGVFPSRFNPDHKATFTIAKTRSWSAVSHNLLDLGLALPGSRLVSIRLQDIGYDRSRLRHGHLHLTSADRFLFMLAGVCRRLGLSRSAPVRWAESLQVVDQTHGRGALAQIQMILQKMPPS